MFQGGPARRAPRFARCVPFTNPGLQGRPIFNSMWRSSFGGPDCRRADAAVHGPTPPPAISASNAGQDAPRSCRLASTNTANRSLIAARRPLTVISIDGLKIGLILDGFNHAFESRPSVLPIDIAVIRRDALEFELVHRIEAGETYFHDLRERWSAALARCAYGNSAYRPYGQKR